MKNIKLFTKTICALFCLTLISVGCEDTFDLDNTDPNNLSVDQADPDFILNEMQLDFVGNVWSDFNAPSRDIVRQENMFDAYGTEVSPTTLDGGGGAYAQTYRSQENLELLKELGAQGEIPYHIGIAQIIQCFNWVLLVDYLGEIPYSEANNFNEFPTPRLDAGSEVYDAVFGLLDEAIDSLQVNSINTPSNDLYYDGNLDNWIALANTIKLKMYLNLKLVDEARAVQGINDLIANENIIDTPEEDFQFRYTTTGPPVESRHPFFTGNYITQANEYMSNYLMYLMLLSRTDVDPRMPYYFYRQTDDEPTGQTLPCAGDPNYEFCYIGQAYWGRDHADGEGLPGDNLQRTTYGVYPGGGAYDDGAFVNVTESDNAGGAGIWPILLSSFTHFMLAEAALTIGTTGDPAVYLETAVNQSLDKVSGFLESPAMGTTEQSDYVTAVLDEYTNAGSDEERLFVITKEYFVAAFGNGVEIYNMYRRTGMPTDPTDPNSLQSIQSPVFPTSPFPRSFPYPQLAVNNNANIRDAQNANIDRVFWDTNPEGFID